LPWGVAKRGVVECVLSPTLEPNKGYDGKTKIRKTIARKEIIPSAAAAMFGVDPEDMPGLFRGHNWLIVVHFET